MKALLILAVCTFFLVPEAINNDDYIIHSITSGAYGEASPELAGSRAGSSAGGSSSWSEGSARGV